MPYPDNIQRIHEYSKGELERIMKTVDELVAKSPNSYSNDGAYVGALVQTLASIEHAVSQKK